jgi:signal transduction histidine kinase
VTVPRPGDEEERLEALDEHRPFASQDLFRNLAETAARICDVPLAAVNVVGETSQETVASTGPELSADREHSFCARTITGDEMLVVEDATEHPAFDDNPYVVGDPGIRFYAGAPLETAEGHRLGTLCLVDTEPRDLDDEVLEVLQRLSLQASALLEHERRGNRLQEVAEDLERRRRELGDLAHVATHQLERPLDDIVENARVLEDRLRDDLGLENRDRLEHVREQGQALGVVVDSMRDHMELETGIARDGPAQLSACLEEVLSGLRRTRDLDVERVDVDGDGTVAASRTAAQIPLKHLVANALSYTEGPVHVAIREDGDRVEVAVHDEGPGIPAADVDRLRQPFQRGRKWSDEPGAGLGLALAERVAEGLGGELAVDAGSDSGTTVRFTLPSASQGTAGPP